MNNHAYDPHSVNDPTGNGIAAFTRWTGSDFRVYANRFDAPLDRWGDAGTIDLPAGQTAGYAKLGADSTGNVTAVMTQAFSSGQAIVANRFVADGGRWGTAVVVSPHDGGAYWPRVAVDLTGNAFAAWIQGNISPTVVWANRYSAATGLWGDAGILSSFSSSLVEQVRLGVDDAGNVLAVWTQTQPNTLVRTFASHYSASLGTWGTAAPISRECCHARLDEPLCSADRRVDGSDAA